MWNREEKKKEDYIFWKRLYLENKKNIYPGRRYDVFIKI